MKRLPVVYRPEAVADLEEIFRYVLNKSCDHITAKRFTNRIKSRCDKVGNAPHGGALRPDLGTNLRLVPFEKSAVILYQVTDNKVEIVNIFYGGRDYDVLMRGSDMQQT